MKILITKFFIRLTLFVAAFVITSNVSAQCTDTLVANTVIITQDTTINANYTNTSFLVCGGILHYIDNSQMASIFIESNGTLDLTGYGYSYVYVKSAGVFDANNSQYMDLYYETGATLIDTASGLLAKQLCTPLIFNYSLLPGGIGCLTSSVNEISSLSNIEISPNPVIDILTIKSKMQNSEFTIIDIFGKKVYQQTMTDQNENFSFNISDLAKGIYFLKMKNPNNFVVKKFIKE